MNVLDVCFQDVKCSGNWMWAAKLPGEGACLWEACKAMCEVMGQLGVAVDGGKDSLSMAARVGKETVKAPGTHTVSLCLNSEQFVDLIKKTLIRLPVLQLNCGKMWL